jgi:hypothetical protein
VLPIFAGCLFYCGISPGILTIYICGLSNSIFFRSVMRMGWRCRRLGQVFRKAKFCCNFLGPSPESSKTPLRNVSSESIRFWSIILDQGCDFPFINLNRWWFSGSLAVQEGWHQWLNKEKDISTPNSLLFDSRNQSIKSHNTSLNRTKAELQLYQSTIPQSCHCCGNARDKNAKQGSALVGSLLLWLSCHQVWRELFDAEVNEW